MRDVAQKGLIWLIIAGVVLAIILGKRRGEQRAQARIDLAVSTAVGDTEQRVRAEFAAQQHVNVAVDASNRSQADHRCDDPINCEVCAPILARILAAGRSRVTLPTGERVSYYAADDHHPDDCAEYSAAIDKRSVSRSSAVVHRNGGGGRTDHGDGRRVGAAGGDVGRSASWPAVGQDGDALYGRGRGPGR